MVKSRKKYTLIGGVKASSKQLSEWGSSGGRPKKYANSAERKRAYRLRKKQARFGNQTQLEPRKTYGQEIIKKYLTCPNCGQVNYDLRQYFNEKGEYIPETYWFDTVRMEKKSIQENQYNCSDCHHAFSFHSGKLKVQEIKTIIPRAGTASEWKQRSRAKKQKSPYG